MPLGWGSIVLMLLGTQWYILFNVIAGAMAIPADLQGGRAQLPPQRWRSASRTLYFPAVFPYLVTGWVTAAGGAWNASIVAEYVTFKGRVVSTPGLGSHDQPRGRARPTSPRSPRACCVMSALVVLFNRIVWRRCYRLAEERFSLNQLNRGDRHDRDP